jgi:hypothetical protein
MLRPLACLAADLLARVSEFIDPDNGSWREEKLRQFLLPMDVEVIMVIPLSTRRHDDFWA